MYFPYFRGKQNELILLRENAELIAESGFTPIIEPVKANFNPLSKSLASLIEAGANFILIVNPRCGELVGQSAQIVNSLLSDDLLKKYPKLTLGYILDEDSDLDDFLSFLAKNPSINIAIIHYGFSNGKALKKEIEHIPNISCHIFMEEHAQKRYRSNFNSGTRRILIRDGFRKTNNREYPNVEHFSELHIMYEEEGMDGFGDFLITGNDYSESGGPAYAVAIHLTFLDSDDDDDMFIKHYVSDRINTPADPGGKFLEALNKLVSDLDNEPKLLQTKATIIFKSLHTNQHYPGLGSIKKLSMQHHIELMAHYFSKA